MNKDDGNDEKIIIIIINPKEQESIYLNKNMRILQNFKKKSNV